MKKYMTVVLEYEPGENCPKVINEITGAFADEKPFLGARVTAISLEDEISRVEQLEN